MGQGLAVVMASVIKVMRTMVTVVQGVTKRCRLSWLTNSFLIYESQCGGWGGGGGLAGVQPMRKDVKMEPR